VDGVLEAAVVARPDEKLDEVPVAFVLVAGGPDPQVAARVERACRRQLADFKVPHQVCLVRALPRSTISKVNKSELRAFLASGDPLEHGERRWITEAAVDPSGDAG
jgi:carnitine-CoA ligase